MNIADVDAKFTALSDYDKLQVWIAATSLLYGDQYAAFVKVCEDHHLV